MIIGPRDNENDDDDDGEARFWDRVERRDEIMGFHDGPPDPGEPYDRPDDYEIEPEDA